MTHQFDNEELEISSEAVKIEETEVEINAEGTELEAFESAEIEDIEFIAEEQLDSILESTLFASDRPVSVHSLRQMFKGTSVTNDQLKRALERFAVELAGARRGVTLEEVTGGYQLRTKVDNMNFLARTVKIRPFKLSGPALEVLAVVAYKQPVIKSEIDEIRGVESGHLLRALMEKNLVTFEGKSDLPGKPMQYATTRKFLEIFGLRNLQELPSLSQIDELLPEGMGEDEGQKQTLSQLTDSLSEKFEGGYSQGEEDLLKISSELEQISSSSEFFEQEKLKQKQKRETERAQNIREALLIGEEVSTRDRNWLVRFDEAQMQGVQFVEEGETQPSPSAAADEAQRASAEPAKSSASELDFIEDESSESEESDWHSAEDNDLADIEG